MATVSVNNPVLVVPRYITACELAQHPLHHQRLGQRSRRGTAEVPSHPPKPKDKGGAEAPSQSDLRVYKSLHERGRRSTSTPTQPQVLTTPRRASRGPTKVDNIFRWRFTCSTSKGPRHQGAVWRFNIINKEQGTISIIELLAHKQNPLQSKQVSGPHADAVSLRQAHALLSFIFEMVRARQAGPHA